MKINKDKFIGVLIVIILIVLFYLACVHYANFDRAIEILPFAL